jgi:hypothetical protein
VTSLHIDFTCKLVYTSQHITLEYAVINHERVSVALCNQIVRVRLDGTFEVSPDIAYVSLDGSTLCIEKLTLHAPGEHLFGLPPFVRMVAPAASFSERVRIALPAKVKNPLRRARFHGPVVADRPSRAENVRFSVGVFAVRDHVALEASEPAWPGLLEISDPDRTLSLQQVISRDLKPAEPIAVLDYRRVSQR